MIECVLITFKKNQTGIQYSDICLLFHIPYCYTFYLESLVL